MNRSANLTPTSFLFMREDFHREDGHSSDLDQRRSGYSTYDSRPQGECDRVAELMMMKVQRKRTPQFSVPPVHCPEECLRAKAVENCQYTSALMVERLKLISVNQFSIYGDSLRFV